MNDENFITINESTASVKRKKANRVRNKDIREVQYGEISDKVCEKNE